MELVEQFVQGKEPAVLVELVEQFHLALLAVKTVVCMAAAPALKVQPQPTTTALMELCVLFGPEIHVHSHQLA